MYKTIEKHTENHKRYILTFGRDFNAELGLGHGNECMSVGRYTVNEGNKRGDWMKQLADVTRITPLSTRSMYRKHTSETNDLQFSKRKRKTN